MRFIVFIDLLGTIILPATAVYMVYLIVTVATGEAAIPYIALAMIGAVYGLQAIIFLLKRQWQYIGWMVIYVRFPCTDPSCSPTRCTVSCCPSTPSGTWTTSRGVTRASSSAKRAT